MMTKSEALNSYKWAVEMILETLTERLNDKDMSDDKVFNDGYQFGIECALDIVKSRLKIANIKEN